MKTFKNDIALMKLTTDLIFNEKVQPSCLPSKTSNTYPGFDIFSYGVGCNQFDFFILYFMI